MDARTDRHHDNALTASRDEHKYLLPRASARALLHLLDQHLRRHRHTPKDGSGLPNASHYATTLYFDTAQLDLYRRAVSSPDQNIKLRAREYYDAHPDLVEVASDREQLYRYQPILWLELKQRDGARTVKRRLGMRKAQVGRFLRRGSAAGDGDFHVESGAAPLDEVCGRFDNFLAHQRGPLSIACALNYRRMAWQGALEGGALRVTLDTELGVFRPDPALLDRNGPLVRHSLGTPAFVEDRVIAEIKLRGRPPAWLLRWQQDHTDLTTGGGKFLMACDRLHGRGTMHTTEPSGLRRVGPSGRDDSMAC